MKPDECVLGVFAKWPEPGKVKTRLAQSTSGEWASRVANAFLRDTLRRLAGVSARRVLAYAPAEARDNFAAIAGTFHLVEQGTGDMGERLDRFFAWAVASGARKVIVVGTDSPSLPVEYVEEAFAALERKDVILGPTSDGGYYLLGCRRHFPELFRAIDWSTCRVVGQTVERVRESGLSLALLPPWYDVDTVEDWQALCGHIQALRTAGQPVDLLDTLALI